MLADRKTILMKFKLNQLLKWNLALQKPARLRVLLSVTPSFFTKETPQKHFANLEYSFPGHFDAWIAQ